MDITHQDQIRTGADVNRIREAVQMEAPTAVPQWREFLVYTVDPQTVSRPEEWHVWAGNVVQAQRAVLANLQLRRDDWVTEIVATIETGESVYG